MIRWGDRWLLILMRKFLKKITGRGFQKARFWTLEDVSCAENCLEVVPLCPDFYIEGWEESSTHWKGGSLMETQNKKISSCRCHFTRFSHRGVRGISIVLERRQSHETPKKTSDTGVNLPRFPHIGVAGITPKKREERMDNDDEHKAKRR